MADSLKDLYSNTEPDDQELHLLRAGLRQKLPPQPRPVFSLWLPAAGLLTAAAIVFVLFMPQPGQDDPFFLSELQVMVAHHPNDALAMADRWQEKDGLHRLDAMMIRVLSAPEGDAPKIAAEAILEEPRPEFRTAYLEYLLDHADEFIFDPTVVETLIDRETDPVNIKLFQTLLDLG